MRKANSQLSELPSSSDGIGSASDGNYGSCDERTAYTVSRSISAWHPVHTRQRRLVRYSSAYPWRAGGRRKAIARLLLARHMYARQPDDKDNATHTFKLFLFEHLASEILSKARFLRSWSPGRLQHRRMGSDQSTHGDATEQHCKSHYDQRRCQDSYA